MEAAQLMANGFGKSVKVVGWGMSANHDIKSQPPAAHFTTILCTKSQHCRFVAARCQQLPHLKKSSSFCGRCWEQFCVFFGPTQRLRFIAWTQLTNSPVLWIGKFLYGRVFLACWLASAGDGRRCSSSLRSCGNSIQGRPPTPPTGHQAHTCKVAPLWLQRSQLMDESEIR